MESIRHILSDVKPESCFWMSDGVVMHNLYELKDGLLTMSLPTFTHHVQTGRNDFANWIRDIIKDNDLADQIRNLDSKESMARVIL